MDTLLFSEIAETPLALLLLLLAEAAAKDDEYERGSRNAAANRNIVKYAVRAIESPFITI